MATRYYLIEVREPDGSVTRLRRALCLDDQAAIRAAHRRVKAFLGPLNLYAEVIVREQQTGRTVFADDDAPSVEQMLDPKHFRTKPKHRVA